jgi:hypothetical protein
MLHLYLFDMHTMYLKCVTFRNVLLFSIHFLVISSGNEYVK